ncbi:MAG: CoB--CoM heterodisulfide reductase iron-sulfur subunit A family protein [Firmicutes bacterium]|nr:CoB--CoM heterodisulfide reductase iron-sulfur subunit A family protein [Bacillota bacterium]
MKAPVLLIGGGVAGMTAALEAAKGAERVILVEAGTRLGGHAALLSCKATDSCQRCGACQARLLEEAVKSAGNIEVVFDCQVTEVKPLPEEKGFLLCLSRNGQVNQVEAQVVIAATGFLPYDAHGWGEYGYGRYPRVITTLDLESCWLNTPGPAELYPGLKRAAFVQCVGSRTSREGGSRYCSRVCCGSTARSLAKLGWEHPGIELTVFHMDLQWNRAKLRRFSGIPGIRLVRSIPSRIYQLPGAGVTVKWENAAGGHEEETFDLVVLAVGMTGSQSGLELEALQGYPGFFLTGAAEKAMDIRESMARGIQAGIRARRLLESGPGTGGGG